MGVTAGTGGGWRGQSCQLTVRGHDGRPCRAMQLPWAMVADAGAGSQYLY